MLKSFYIQVLKFLNDYFYKKLLFAIDQHVLNTTRIIKFTFMYKKKNNIIELNGIACKKCGTIFFNDYHPKDKCIHNNISKYLDTEKLLDTEFSIMREA